MKPGDLRTFKVWGR